jgi:mono/diheme cytochrome c family protein
MRSWLAVTGVIALAFVAESPEVVWAADDGKTVYAKKCASCHGDKGEGKPTIAKMMKVEFRHLGSKEVQAKSDAELAKSITEGIDKMKPVKGLSEGEVTAVIAHVRTLKP